MSYQDLVTTFHKTTVAKPADQQPRPETPLINPESDLAKKYNITNSSIAPAPTARDQVAAMRGVIRHVLSETPDDDYEAKACESLAQAKPALFEQASLPILEHNEVGETVAKVDAAAEGVNHLNDTVAVVAGALKYLTAHKLLGTLPIDSNNTLPLPETQESAFEILHKQLGANIADLALHDLVDDIRDLAQKTYTKNKSSSQSFDHGY